MSTRLEEIQAAVRAKQQAGQPVFSTPVDAPKMPTVTGTVTPPPTTSTISPGLPPVTNTNYSSGGTSAKTTYTAPPAAPTTNYGGTGNALNEILYSKKQYDAGNKGWAAQNAQQYYSQLDPSESAAVSKMNTQQLTDYINSKNQPAANTGGDTAAPVPNIPNYGMNTGFVPAAPAQAPDYTNIMDTIRNSYMSDIKSQSLSIQQALDKAIAASQLNVNQNNNQLQEHIRGLTNQKAQLDDAAQQLQNRRGGFYSGGLDYQLSGINKNTQQATSDAQRDVATRNDAIYANNSLLAQQAADTIKQLETAAPDKIRELIRQAINDERSFGLQEGALTGSYNGNPTLAAQQFQWGQQVDSANLTGQFNGQKTLAGQQQAWNQQQDTINNNAQYGGTYNGNKTVQQQQQEWQNRFNYGQTIGQFQNGQQTLDAKNQAFNQNVTMAQLTGYLPDGTPTSAQQQQNLANLWNVADATGVIPDSLATMYGLPKGTQTQAAFQFAQQLAISRQNANTSSNSNANSNANAQFNQLMDVWKATGTAPAGLEAYGVSQGAAYTTGAAAKAAEPKVYEDYQANIDKVAQRDKKGNITNPEAVKKYISGSPMSNYEKYRAWIASGLEWPSNVEIPSPGE